MKKQRLAGYPQWYKDISGKNAQGTEEVTVTQKQYIAPYLYRMEWVETGKVCAICSQYTVG